MQSISGQTALLAAGLLLVGNLRVGVADAQTPDVITGQVVDATAGTPIRFASVTLFREDGQPLLPDGSSVGAVTDSAGRFELNRVPDGMHLLQVSHLGYGVQRHAVLLEGTGTASIMVYLSPTAIRLSPLVIDDPGTNRNAAPRRSPQVALRPEIEPSAAGGISLVDYLTQRFSGLRQRRSGDLGSQVCVEFRQAEMRGPCRFPTVFVDGISSYSAAALTALASVPLLTVERIQIVPPADAAGGSYGLNAGLGTIIVDTRLAPERPLAAPPTLSSIRLRAPYDWAEEPRPYPWPRVYAAAFAGNAVGLAAGLTLAAQCVDLQRGSLRYREIGQRRDYRCHPSVVMASGLIATVLPSLAGGAAGRMAGVTDRSAGALAFSAIASQAIFIPAAVIMVTDNQSGRLGAGKIAGLALAIVGAPLLTVLSDRFVRILR